MKMILYTLIALLLTTSAFPQAYYNTYNGFTVPTAAVLPPAESHPTLWFNSSDIAALQNKRNADSYAMTVWNRAASVMTGFRSQTPSSMDFNDRPRMAKALAFYWLMTGDTLSRRKAIECLLIAYDNVPRSATSANFSGDYDEIYRATWLQNYCAAYDWMHNQLSLAQDTLIRRKIAEEVMLLRNNMVAGVRYAPRPHNHRSKPAWGIVTAGLTLSSDSRAADWVTFGLTQANTVTKYQFSADGIYREGSHYLIYSLVNYLPYLWQYKSVSGQDHFQYYKPSLEMAVRLRSAKGWMPNIEDSYVKPMPAHMFAAHFKSSPTILHSSAPLANILQWHWANTNFFTTAYTGASADVVWEIDEYITYDPSIPKTPPDMKGTQLIDCGVTVFRDSETVGSTPARYLLFHAVAECDNHQHEDLLSYVLEFKGTPLAVDPGYGKDGYDDAKRPWYIAPASHNMVTVNAKGPLDWADNVKPFDTRFLNNPNFSLSEKRAKTNVTDGSITRGIAFIENKFWAVYDMGTGASPVDYSLNIHSRGALSRAGGKATWTTASDNYGTVQKLHVIAGSNPASVISEKTGYTSLWKDEAAQSYMELKHTTPKSDFLHILFPDEGNSAFPDMTDISTAGCVAFRVRAGNEHTIVLKQTANTVTVGGVSTDANFTCASTLAGSLKSFLLMNGQSLQYAGTTFFSSGNRITLHCERGTQTGVDILNVDTLLTAVQISYRPSFFSTEVLAVLFNGSAIPFSVSGESILFTCPSTGKVEVRKSGVGINDGGLLLMPSLHLFGNFPNPFNNSTRIRFFSATRQPVTISIHNALGKNVRQFVVDSVSEGIFNVHWDGKNHTGEEVASGMYLVHLNSSGYTASQKCVLLK